MLLDLSSVKIDTAFFLGIYEAFDSHLESELLYVSFQPKLCIIFELNFFLVFCFSGV